MKNSKKKWGFITVGLVAVLSLGAIGVAGAATRTSAASAGSRTTTALHTRAHDRAHDGSGAQAGAVRGYHGGSQLDQALANLSGTDLATIVSLRASGQSYADIAKAKGIDTQTLLAEATRLETASLDAAVKAGTMTEAQRTERLSTMQTRLNDQLTETHAFGSGGGQGNGGGQGYRGGQGSGGSCGGGSGTCQAGTSATT